jgi:hypothetical protein
MSDPTADLQSLQAANTDNLIPDSSELFREERAAAEGRIATEERAAPSAHVVTRRRDGSDGPRWGDDIPQERQRELDERLAA